MVQCCSAACTVLLLWLVVVPVCFSEAAATVTTARSPSSTTATSATSASTAGLSLEFLLTELSDDDLSSSSW